MKKILLLLIFIFLLSACGTSTYFIISEEPVDNYDIYQEEQKGLFCNTYFEDVYYSGETYNYGLSYIGCDASMTFFIMHGNEEYVYLRDALDQGLITLDSLMPELMELERNPEEISSEDADYYWLDFHINNQVVYAYAGGVCDYTGSETFVIKDKTYTYSASGCLKDNILFMRINGDSIPVATLLNNGTINGDHLIPLLTEQSD